MEDTRLREIIRQQQQTITSLGQTKQSLFTHIGELAFELSNKEEELQEVQKKADHQMESHEIDRDSDWMRKEANIAAYSQIVDVVIEKNAEINNLKRKIKEMDHHAAATQATTTASITTTIEEKEKEILQLKEHADLESTRFEQALKAQIERREKFKASNKILMRKLRETRESLLSAMDVCERLQGENVTLKDSQAEMIDVIEGNIADRDA
ncbi:hypothetical protein B7494_g6147 [Chlorociboria aeruginascens]|nr:hypothetical protein B7494_g6147 [Chlorociboria aeruginascens]